MLHAGLSLQIFKKWAPNENNMVIMPGYCVAGTIGHKILGGAKKVELENKQVIDVKMSVEYMSFSAHADAKGIMQLIQQCEPKNVLLVHGEASKMEFLQGKIKQEFGLNCYMPANGETVNVPSKLNVPVDVSLNLLKRTLHHSSSLNVDSDPKKPKVLHGTLVMTASSDGSPLLRLLEPEKAMADMGIKPHQIRFTSTVRLEDRSRSPPIRIAEVIYQKLKRYLP